MAKKNIEEIVRAFGEVVGSEHVLQDEAAKQQYGRDWTKDFAPQPLLVVLPGSSSEVCAVMKYCHDHDLAIVPSGGRTGLAAAAVAANGEVVLSLQRLNQILSIDEIGLTAEVEAGVTTQALQEAASERGLFFALDLAAKGSSQIGGNIATNAGGLKLIRYGGMREQVLGLEVVLANGDVLNLNTALRKNNTGYDLKQLFIGSEGTLGVITKATLRLMPPPPGLRLCCFAVASFREIPQLLRLTTKHRVALTAFEFFDEEALAVVLTNMPQCRCPFTDRPPFTVLIEAEEDGEGGCFDRFIEEAFSSGLAQDGVVAGSSQQFHELWALRENISEAVSGIGYVHKNDISVPVAKLEDFVSYLGSLDFKLSDSITLISFGHIGDGNLHLNYVSAPVISRDAFNDQVRSFELQIFEKLKDFQGSISAEHGIGLLKKKDLAYSVSEMQLHFMKQLKQIFDPKGLLNPGKIFD